MSLTAQVNRSGLDAVLARARRDSVEFPYLLANHVPMVLIALDRLGASPRRLEEWYEAYRDANGLISAPAHVAPIGRTDWDTALGDRTREADYRRFFAGEVGRLGADGAIRFYLPPLVQGVAASATHPLMRLAYGLLAEDDDEIAVALGYWATTHLPLPAPTGAVPDTDDPAEVLAGIAEIEGVRNYQPETDLLWHNIRAVAALPGFRPVVDRLAFSADTPRRMAATGLALFVGTMDFAALHAVTGLHWARIVAPHLDDGAALYRAFWQVIASLVPKIGFPSLPSAETLESMRVRAAPPWSAIKEAAIRSDDEHDVSLAFSCLQEEAAWGDPLYRVAASRRLGLMAWGGL
jgi:Questin oxidase-like